MAVPTQQQISFSGSPLTGADMLDEIVAMLKSLAVFREGGSPPSDILEGEFWAYNGVSPNVDIYRRMADGSDIAFFRINKTNKTLTLMNMTDLPVVDGGTGASTASGARSNLGLVIGTAIGHIAAYTDDGSGNAIIDFPNKGAQRYTNRAQTRTLTGATTLTTADHGKIILLDYSGGSFDVTLPAHAAGLQFTFIVIDATNSGDIVDSGSATVETMDVSGQKVVLCSANSTWHELEHHASLTVELGGDFDAGEEVTITRSGKLVHVFIPYGVYHDASAFLAPQSSYVLPVSMRPGYGGYCGKRMISMEFVGSDTSEANNDQHYFISFMVHTDGYLRIEYLDRYGDEHDGVSRCQATVALTYTM